MHTTKLVALLALGAGLSFNALAQSSVTVYGLVDEYVGAIRSNGKTTTMLENGGIQISRIGFTGTEDLGGGWLANFRLENGFNADTGAASNSALSFGRQSWVGLQSRKYGEIRFGLQQTPFFYWLGNTGAFYGGLFGSGMNTESSYTVRVANDIAYITPTWNGFNGELHYALGESARSNTEGRTMQVHGQYRNGPFYAVAGYMEQRVATTAPAPYLGDKIKQGMLGGSYDIGAFTLYAGWFRHTRTDGLVNKDLSTVGLGWQVTPLDRLGFGYTFIDTKADTGNVVQSAMRGRAHTNHFGIAYFHTLSKRTTLYASAATIDNGTGATYAIGSAQPPNAGVINRPTPGTSTTGLQLGVRHTF